MREFVALYIKAVSIWLAVLTMAFIAAGCVGRPTCTGNLWTTSDKCNR